MRAVASPVPIPYAVRALEAAAGGTDCCCAPFLREWYSAYADASGVPYLRGRPFYHKSCTVDTAFYVESEGSGDKDSVRRLAEAGKWTHPCNASKSLPLGHEYVAMIYVADAKVMDGLNRTDMRDIEERVFTK